MSHRPAPLPTHPSIHPSALSHPPSHPSHPSISPSIHPPTHPTHLYLTSHPPLHPPQPDRADAAHHHHRRQLRRGVPRAAAHQREATPRRQTQRPRALACRRMQKASALARLAKGGGITHGTVGWGEVRGGGLAASGQARCTLSPCGPCTSAAWANTHTRTYVHTPMCAFLQAELGAAGTSDVLAHNVPGFDDAAELVGDNKNNVRSEMMPTCAAHAPHMHRTRAAHAPHMHRTCTTPAHLHVHVHVHVPHIRWACRCATRWRV